MVDEQFAEFWHIAYSKMQVLDRLGISMSSAVGMFLRQVVLRQGMPFEMKLPQEAPIGYGPLTKEQFDSEIEKGMANIQEGRDIRRKLNGTKLNRDLKIITFWHLVKAGCFFYVHPVWAQSNW